MNMNSDNVGDLFSYYKDYLDRLEDNNKSIFNLILSKSVIYFGLGTNESNFLFFLGDFVLNLTSFLLV